MSGDINLNLSLAGMWSIFKKRGLHFLHLNINSLSSKIDKVRKVAINNDAALIGISETKLDKTICDSEIAIENYSLEEWRDRCMLHS